ncbi:hypothetical protein ASPZODRAFT_145778 [Penicilliopsis zonata CBS 506.65]|uniref:Protein transport protein sec16 n=1 Tax=Penicilliopsis zonata CBS 506.65 TaxID=1073090 RepID=A0A1L9S9I4_9EURO|nr:hypothetical protein ASPZODRAFT_145778 [Penicilliopsis zonata CBS 506.65]OJJ43842.1 hypothetical protein ASPZODRAFT_145778 [Penicilliopsis zonata CBS 506.65]
MSEMEGSVMPPLAASPSWNPAFRPDEQSPSHEADPDTVALDTQEQIAEPVADIPDSGVTSTSGEVSSDKATLEDVNTRGNSAQDAPDAETTPDDQHETSDAPTEILNEGKDASETLEQQVEAPDPVVESESTPVDEEPALETAASAPNLVPQEDAFEQVPIERPTEDLFPSATDDTAQSGAFDDSMAWMNEDEGKDTTVTSNGDVNNEAAPFWANDGDDNDDDDEEGGFFDQLKTQTKPIYVPPEAESRFEEGVPLLDESTDIPTPLTTHPETQIQTMFDEGEDEEDDGFFSSVQKSTNEDSQQSFHITRKSTSQVMGSLDLTPDSPMVDSPSAPLPPTDSTTGLTATVGAIKKQSSEEDLAARWQAELSDDDDLLLGDDADEQEPVQAVQEPSEATVSQQSVGLGSPFATPQSTFPPRTDAARYTPHQPSTSDLVNGIPLVGAATPQANVAPVGSYFAPRPALQTANRTESFVDSKSGYKSPYDLPEDLTRTRRPVVTQKPVVAQPGTMPPPPPRSSSMTTLPPVSTMPPPSAVPSMLPGGAPPVVTPVVSKNFFEELPLPQRPRPAPSGRYTPDHSSVPPAVSHMPPPPPPPPAVTTNAYASVPPPSHVLSPTSEASYQSQLQQPERMDPYANHLAPAAPAPPSAASRYSPKPPGLQVGAKPSASPRYSPAPPPSSAPPARNRYVSQPVGVASPTNSLPFQPRTSSPLAYHEKAVDRAEAPPALSVDLGSSPPRRSHLRQSIDQSSIMPPNIPVIHEGSAAVEPATRSIAPPAPLQQDQSPPRNRYAPAAPQIPTNAYAPLQEQNSPPRNPYAPQEYVNEFSKRVAPVGSSPPPALPVVSAYATPSAGDSQFGPPRRSQTQSPRHVSCPQTLSIPPVEPHQRPASTNTAGSPTKAVNPYSAPSHNRISSQQLDFIPPTDGLQLDPLERWKGAPIFKFGFGGITSCFPKHIPRYSAGQVAPMIKSSPGIVNVSQFNTSVVSTNELVRHPGPLKTKAKKKDLLAWLSSKITAFENEGSPDPARSDDDAYKRHDEKVLLWKVVKILVEHDGSLDGTVDIQKSVRNVIFPHLQAEGSDAPYGNGYTSTASSFQPVNTPSQPDAVDAQSLETLRNYLVAGDREKAVWAAVDQRLFGHAMIIASTMDKAVWKQVVQEFVRREVRTLQGKTKSLAALYEIFAGNIEESIDELVPPSARAGFQMVSMANGQGPAQNALEGLESWRETLGLVLNNRSPEDHQALLALGQLLFSYGRVEAAHICYIFSRSSTFGGADDVHANIVLLGADHQRSPTSLLDDDTILLTEAYEYATSVLANSPTASMPHLHSFKLLHARSLAERGCTSEAQQYCDAIASSVKATTRPSGYHHQHLFSEVDELSARLKQATSDSASSWMSKPNMEKVSGSMWAKFNSFVAGEDSDVGSTGSGRAGDADLGPFAKITGTPTVSRSPSVSDLYGSYPGSGAQPIPAGASSRYHPSNQYAPNSSPEQYRGRSSLDSQRSPSFAAAPFGQRRGSQDPSTPIDSINPYQFGQMYGSPQPIMGYQSTPPQSSYMPLAPVEEDSSPRGPATPATPQLSSMPMGSYQPQMQPAPAENAPVAETHGYTPPTSNYGYEPPSGGYEPAAPSAEDEDETPVDGPPKHKSFMGDDDDEDDLAARAASIQKAEKARKDREADDAFKAAAEADSKRPSHQQKKSWFGGWFGAKKEADNIGGGPIRAKLGEESSFYYDNELKKWVNKKDPNSATPTAATPPPPRAPSRTASASSAPPLNGPPPPAPGSNPNSRPSSAAGVPPPFSGLGTPPPPNIAVARSVSTGATMLPTPPSSASGLAPPRPASSLSHATSIDDLIGAPQPRKGGASKAKKKGRGYVDVMAK